MSGGLMVLTMLCALVLPVARPAAAPQLDKEAATLAGKWSGLVNTDAGQMQIDVTLEVVDGKARGTIATGHGDLNIVGGIFEQGKWTLPFSGHGMQGRMVATLKGDALTGEWVNPGVAVGTFSLARMK
jgi:hypothetical protein